MSSITITTTEHAQLQALFNDWMYLVAVANGNVQGQLPDQAVMTSLINDIAGRISDDLKRKILGRMTATPVCQYCHQGARGMLRTAQFHTYDPYCSYLCQRRGLLAGRSVSIEEHWHE